MTSQPVTLPSMAALQAFERTAALGSLSAAAAEMGRTPSALSHAIKGLEERLGVSLFERSGRAISLTPAGKNYLGQVGPALRDLSLATSALINAQNAERVRVSALAFFTSTVLIPRLDAFRAAFPRIDLRIETTHRFANVQQGEADIAIRFGKHRDSSLVCEPLLAIRAVPVASRAYLETHGKPGHPRELGEHMLIHVTQQADAWKAWHQAAGVDEPREASEDLVMDSVAGALDAARGGLGISLAMFPLFSQSPDYVSALVPLMDDITGPTEHYYAVYAKSSAGRRSVVLTLQWLREICQALEAGAA